MRIFERSWVLLVLWAVSVVLAFVSAAPIFFNLAYLLGGILILSFLWAWLNIHWVRVSRYTRAERIHFGDILEEVFQVTNTGYLPKLWLEVDDFSEFMGHHASHVISNLGGKQQQDRTIRTMALRRGRFRLGPVMVLSGDPLGLFHMRKVLNSLTAYVVVYPRTVELPYFQPLLGEISGGEVANRRTHYVTTNVSGVRDYAPGDSFNRIHWPSVARTGRLVVKEFELDPMADVWFLVDMNRVVHVGPTYEALPPLDPPDAPWLNWTMPDMEPNTEEYTISVAASLMRYFLRRDRAVGLITYANGTHVESISSDRGHRQEDRLLGILSVLHPNGVISLEQVLAAEGSRFNRNTTLLIVTPSVKSTWVAGARDLAGRGVKVTAVVIDPGSFGAPFNADEVVGELTASHVPNFVIRQGDNIQEVLATVAPRGR